MKLPFLPEKSGYTVAEGPFRSVESTVPAPVPIVGKGFPNTHNAISCNFILTEAEFPQFMSFYRDHETGITFEADLIADTGDLQEYKCKFEQQSLKVTNSALTYYVSVKILALKV